jgi:hypothetical protein
VVVLKTAVPLSVLHGAAQYQFEAAQFYVGGVFALVSKGADGVARTHRNDERRTGQQGKGRLKGSVSV